MPSAVLGAGDKQQETEYVETPALMELTFWCRRHRPILSQVIKRNERMLGATPGLVGRSGGLTGGPKR